MDAPKESRLWDYAPDDMVEAYLGVTDDHKSQRKSASERGVPRTTLRDRLKGVPAKGDRPHPDQRLTCEREARLARWIIRQDSLGYGPSNATLRVIVKRILELGGDNAPLGIHWLDGFKRRNPDVSSAMSSIQEAKRFNSFTSMAVN